jgi:hypothetical protein
MGRRLVKFNTETFRGNFDVLPNAREEDGSFAVVTDRNNDVYMSRNGKWTKVNNSGFDQMTLANLLANYPPTSNAGFIAVLTDVNNIAVISDGTRYKPLGGIALLGKLGADITTTGAEAIMFQVAIPAGLLKAGDSITKQISASKSADVETLNYRLRMGTAGTLSDTSIQDFTLATGGGGNRTMGFIAEWKVSSATTIDRVGNASQSTSFIGSATATEPSPSVIDNLDTNAMFISDTLALTGTSTVGKLRSSIITWIAK